MSIAEKLTTIAESLPEVYDAGNEYQNNKIWKAITDEGTRTNYSGAFRYKQWYKNNFLPTYDITPTNASMMFRSVDPGVDELQIDMEELEKKQGIRFDFSNCTDLSYAFAGGLFKTLNVIDVSSCTGASSGHYMFYAAYSGRKLNRINRLIFGENTKPHSTWFGYCYDLIHIGFEGILAQNWADVSACKYLDKESITKLIGILSSSTSGLTITLSKKAVNTAFGIDIDDEATYPEGSEYYNLRNTKSNWTFNYV